MEAVLRPPPFLVEPGGLIPGTHGARRGECGGTVRSGLARERRRRKTARRHESAAEQQHWRGGPKDTGRFEERRDCRGQEAPPNPDGTKSRETCGEEQRSRAVSGERRHMPDHRGSIQEPWHQESGRQGFWHRLAVSTKPEVFAGPASGAQEVGTSP
ncbi:hypothetical protein NDU88_002232 [Pleurodeles waltl]|uniref:Uncharacterized protein n=1 Tax=Pleurodeles waltl TaxID=8319 RepID=A0AAV7U8U2_PLEWA|nr:hypothetical protein NDU88_002232 [Pleurodeles waltl]